MGAGAFLSSLLALFVALVFVLALAWGFIWLLRKWQDQQSGDSVGGGRQSIRFLRSLPLGQRERVTMIAVNGEVLLLGIAAGGISLLARWPDDTGEAAGADMTADERERTASGLFSLANFPSLRGKLR